MKTACCDPCGRTAPRDCVSFIPYENSGAAQSDTNACCRCRGLGPGECEGCTCEHCGKQQPTAEERETILVGDPRLAGMCWARPEHGDLCPALAEQERRAEDDSDPPDFDPMGCPGCGGNCARACR